MSTYEEATQSMDAAKAVAIINVAKPLGAYEGDLPTDVAEQVKDANELLRIAKTSYDGGIRSQVVLEILGTAGVDVAAEQASPPPAQPGLVTMIGPDNSETQVPEAAVAALEGAGFKRKEQPAPPPPTKQKLVPPGGGEPQEFDATAAAALTGSGWTPYQPPTAQPAPAAVPPPATQAPPGTPPPAQPDPAPSGFDINAVIPGFDDMKVKDIVPAMRAITDEATFNAVKEYDAANEDRKTISNLVFEPPQQAAPPPGGATPPAAGGQSGHAAYGDSADMERAYSDGSGGQETIMANQLPEPGVGELEIKVEIDTYTDQALAQLQTRYHNADVRALALLGQQEGLRDLAIRMHADATAAVYAKFLAEEKAAIEKMTASAADGASSRAKHRSESDETVRQMANRIARHGAEVRNLKARQAAYEKGVARLSREQTRREKEKELGGQRG